MAIVEALSIEPQVVTFDRTIRKDWDYDKSVAIVKAHWISFKNITEEMLHHLWVAKTVLVGNRKAGVPKKGQLSWAKYLKEAGLNQKTIDSYIKKYCENGMKKPASATKTEVEDANIYRVHSYTVVDGIATIKFELDNSGVIKTEQRKA